MSAREIVRMRTIIPILKLQALINDSLTTH